MSTDRNHYVCGEGHESSTPKPQTLKRCPSALCKAPGLRLVGPGSRKAAMAR